MQDAEPSWLCCGRCQWPLCRLHLQWKPTGEFYFTMSYFAFLPYWFLITGPGSLRLTQSQEIFWRLKQIFNFAARFCLETLKLVQYADMFQVETCWLCQGHFTLPLLRPHLADSNLAPKEQYGRHGAVHMGLPCHMHSGDYSWHCTRNKCKAIALVPSLSEIFCIFNLPYFFCVVYMLLIITLWLLNRETWKGKRLPRFGILTQLCRVQYCWPSMIRRHCGQGGHWGQSSQGGFLHDLVAAE